MNVKYCISFLFLCIMSISCIAQTLIQGNVKDDEGYNAIGASIFLFKNNKQVKIKATDFDGNYLFLLNSGGTYDMKVSALGLQAVLIKSVIVTENGTTKIDVSLESKSSDTLSMYSKSGSGSCQLVSYGLNSGLQKVKKEETIILEDIIIREYRVPLVNFDCCGCGAKQIKTEPIQRVQQLPMTKLDERMIDLDILVKEIEQKPIGLMYNNQSIITAEISSYPNPSTTADKIMIESSEAFEKVIIYSLTGQKIIEQTTELRNDLSLRTPNSSGIYILQLFRNGQVLEGSHEIVVVD